MEGDVGHKLAEFKNFPWDKMDDLWFSSCGGVGCGGIIGGVNFNPREPHISFVDKDASCDCWEIPLQLMRLLDAYYERGKRDLQNELRELLNARRND